ncbi:MAG: hypothetical protein LBQ46_04265 [Treponema sp.]|jgi:hypothetical protein|nr:hypothetical protein [Treponema sp.]
MKKHAISAIAAIIGAGILVFLASCINPIGFADGPIELSLELSGEVGLTGTVDTKDVTAASTYIVNMSKTLDFLDVTITQKENPKLASEVPPYLISKFDNTKDSGGNWKIVKTKYVQASDIEYEVELSIQSRPAGASSFKLATDVFATQSRGIYYVWIYRTTDQTYINKQKEAGVPDDLADVVVVSPNDPNAARPFPPPSPGDTNTTINIDVGGSDHTAIVAALQSISNALVNLSGANTTEKTAEEENGSVPPIISPQNRTVMGTFVVVNLSRSRNVDWVQFVDEGRTFGAPAQNLTHTLNSVTVTTTGGAVAYPAVAVQDRRGIGLLQGNYKITAGHNVTEKTSVKTGVIMPSNDPQSIREHYLYFYKDKSGNYVINVERPADNDLDPTDVLPPAQGSGVGRITLVNRTTKAVLQSVTLEARDNPQRGDKTWLYSDFVRHAPINAGSDDYVDVLGTAEFPIDGFFLATVNAVTAEGNTAITRLIYLNNTIAEIIVTDNDLGTFVPGARITVNNRSTTTSLVSSVKISDANTSSNYQVYTTNVGNGQTTTFDVLNSVGMPIAADRNYTAQAAVTVTKQFEGTFVIDGENVVNPVIQNTGTIPVTITPNGQLYGDTGPASCLRTITINESDITGLIPSTPTIPATPFIPVTDVLILNGDYTANGVQFFAKDGVSRTLQWKVIPENATNPTGYWKLGYLDATNNSAHVTLSTTGVLNVKSTWGLEYVYVAFVVENGIAQGVRNPVTTTVGTLLVAGIDLSKDFVTVIKLCTPPPGQPQGGGVLLNYVGKGAGGNNSYPGGEWSVNLIEVYKRPAFLTKKDGTQGNAVTDSGGGVLTYGNLLTGKTGVHWQANPNDENNIYFGGTSEGWITGNWGSINTSNGVASVTGGTPNALKALSYPALGAPLNTAIASKDRQNMAFAYYDGGTYKAYKDNFNGETRPYFLGSINLTQGTTRGAGVSGEWVKQTSSDNKLNASGEQYRLNLPTDQGKLWIRMRMDYSDGTVGYWWKAVYLQEWFVFDPSNAATYKGSKDNIVIDVDLYNTPYMTYRK